MRSIILITMMALLLCASALWAADAPPPAPAPSSTATTPAEAKLGEETAKDIESEYKLIKEEKILAKLNQMATEIAPLTQRPDVKYTCKILDTGEINAMAIPGGTIYFTKGLLNAVESDDELAGVMAHEIAHNSLHHADKLMNREKKFFIPQLLGTLAAYMLSQSSGKTNNDVSPFQLLAVGQMVKQSIMSGYSQDVENEADKFAVDYLYKSKFFDPNGIYSVILGFRQMKNMSAHTGVSTYLDNHPEPEERLRNITKEMNALRVPINMWPVVNFRAKVIPPKEGETGYQLKLGSVKLITLTAADGDKDAQARAQAAEDAMNQRLELRGGSELSRFDIKTKIANDGSTATIFFRETPVLTLILADVDPAGKASLAELAQQINDSIRSSFFSERLKREMDSGSQVMTGTPLVTRK